MAPAFIIRLFLKWQLLAQLPLIRSRLRPERILVLLPVPKLILQIRMPIEHHQRAFPFQVAHKRRHTNLRRYAHWHMHMIWHQMSFYNLYAFVCAKIMKDLSKILLVLIVDYFSSILWRKDDMVLAQPFGMCSTISLWHEITFPFSVVAWTPLLYGKVISLLNDLSPPA